MNRPALRGASAAFLLSLVAVVLALVASLGFWLRTPVNAVGVQRLPQPFATSSNATIEAAIKRLNWTEYADYGTVLIDRVERRAWLMMGRKEWIRQVSVPPGGARYEMFVGAIDAPVTVRIGRAGGVPSETRATMGAWTPVTLDLDSRDGATQSVTVDVEAPAPGIAACGAELVIPSRRPESSPPNVVLISLDTVRRDQLTPYVPSLSTTPTLAALAREAVVFDQAISTSSWTVASHATLFTGHFPADSLGYSSRVEPQEDTLPEIFAADGFRTFGVSGGPYMEPRWGMHQGFDTYVVAGDRENAREATSRAIAWMTDAGNAPLFLFLNYFDAHEPLALSPDVRLAAGVTEDVPGQVWSDLDLGHRAVTPAIRDRLLRAYRAELSSIDGQLRRLFENLQRNGRWNSTVVIVWADHGQLLGERGHIGHAYTLEEELLRVPLLIKPAAGSRLTPGRYQAPIQNDDLFTLIQALAGFPNAEGAKIVSAISTSAPIRRLSFSKIHHDPLPDLVAHPRWRSATQWAVRDGSTKIVRDLEGHSFAYDVTRPGERPIPMPGGESVLVAQLNLFLAWSEQMPSSPTVRSLRAQEIERLRTLGYVAH